MIVHFVAELLVTAAVAGGLAGWLLGRSPQAALATALARCVFALGPGHNIPFLGGTPAVGKGVVLLVAIVVVAALTLVESQPLVARLIAAGAWPDPAGG